MQIKKRLLVVALGAAIATPATVWAGELEDLKADMLKMMERIEHLETQKGVTAKPAKTTVRSGSSKARVTLSGHINRAVLLTDDGDSTDVHHVDNENSNSRFRILGEVDASETLTVGSVLEVEFESNSSGDVSQSNTDDASPNNFQRRKFEIYFADTWGKLWMGQGDMASNGTSEVDLSGTTLAGYSAVGDVAGGYMFYDNMVPGLGTVTIGDAFSQMDGQSRRNRLRYDTPNMSGFVVSASHGENDRGDVALRYGANFDGTKVAGALAYSDNRDIDGLVNGSISALLANGFNVTFAAGETGAEAAGRSDPMFYYTKLGYKMGDSAYSVDYYSGDDIDANDDESESIGFQYVRNIPNWGTEAYLQVRQFSLDSTGTDYEDIYTLITGARVKF
ncbi:MAG: porin [Halopseudomonas sp.]